MDENNRPVKSRTRMYMGVVTGVLVLQAALFYTASSGDSTPLNTPLVGFPRAFGSWQLKQEGVVEKETLDVLRADDTLTRWYNKPDGAGANLFIAFFKTQRYGQSPHSPKNCLPGSGWQWSESGTIAVPVRDETIRINRYVVAKGDEESVVLYWYQSQGAVIADEFAAKYYLVRNSIRSHRSDTSLVRIVVPVVAGHKQEADATALAFVKDAYPVIKSYLPQ
jgi:EpsI family protein